LKSGFVFDKTGFQAISAPCFRVSVVNPFPPQADASGILFFIVVLNVKGTIR